MSLQEGGPYHSTLRDLLGAYVCYRPDLGYVQGMSFIAAILLLNLEEAEAFIVFANLVNRPLLAAFYRVIENILDNITSTLVVFRWTQLP